MTKAKAAALAKRAVATFLFVFSGALIGLDVLEANVEVWKTAASVAIGSIVNLANREAGKWLDENDDDE
jgi:hypothetical protein